MSEKNQNRNQDTTAPGLKNFLTEQDLCELLGMSKTQIGVLRRDKGLPFIKLTDRVRLYFEQDLVEYFLEHKMILNRHSSETKGPIE